MNKIIYSLPLAIFTLVYFNCSAQFYQPLCSKAFMSTESPMLIEDDGFICLENLQAMATKYWPYNKNISVKTASEIESTIHYNRTSSWVILSAGYRDEIKTIQGKKTSIKVYVVSLHLSEDAAYRSGKNVDKKFVFKMDFPYCVSSELEMKLFFKLASERIKQMAPKKMSSTTMKKVPVSAENAQNMTVKTLLIPKEYLAVPEEEIKQYYSHPFKVLSTEEIHKKIEEGSEDEMVLNVVWSDKKINWSLMAFDLKTYDVNLSIPQRNLDINTMDKDFSKDRLLSIEKLDLKINDKMLKKMNSTIAKLLATK